MKQQPSKRRPHMPKPAGRFFANLQSEFLPPPVSCTLFCPWLPVHVAISQVSEAVPSAARCLTLRPKAAGSLLLPHSHGDPPPPPLSPCTQSLQAQAGAVSYHASSVTACHLHWAILRRVKRSCKDIHLCCSTSGAWRYGAGRSKIQSQPLS